MKKGGLDTKKLKGQLKQPKDVHQEILEIRAEVSRLMQVFDTAVSFMKEEKPVASQNEVLSKLNQLLDENSILAKGIMKATRQLEGIGIKLNELENMVGRVSERRVPISRAPAKSPNPLPPPPRRAIFEKYKREFSK